MTIKSRAALRAELLHHAQQLADDAANYLTSEVVLPCDEGNALAEALGTLAMEVREDMRSPLDNRKTPSPECDLAEALQELHDACEFWDNQDDPVLVNARKALDRFHASRTIKIEILGGCLSGVSNLPKGWDYELIDHDNESEAP